MGNEFKSKEQLEKEGFSVHELKTTVGVSDLKGLCAFTGSVMEIGGTNDPAIGLAKDSWHVPAFGKDFIYTKENINDEIAARKKWNDDYIAKCKADGSYGKVVPGHRLVVKNNPIFDYGARKPKNPVAGYEMKFVDGITGKEIK